MAFSFPSELFPDVRAVIGQEVTESILPDPVLALPTFQGETERFIDNSLAPTTYESLDATQQSRANIAAVYYLASIAAPTLPEVLGETMAGGSISYNAPDYDAIGRSLFAKANEIVAEIDVAIGQPVVASNPNIFTKAPRKYW